MGDGTVKLSRAQMIRPLLFKKIIDAFNEGAKSYTLNFYQIIGDHGVSYNTARGVTESIVAEFRADKKQRFVVSRLKAGYVIMLKDGA